MSADLKPCPFCGSDGEELGLCYDTGSQPLVGTDWFVRCYVCHVETERFVTQAEAIAAWNTRAEGPAPVSAIKADPASVLPVLAHLVETGQATPQQRLELAAALNLPAAPNLDLVERLREMVKTDHLRGCEGREYECTCGHIDRQDNLMLEAASALSQQDQVGLTTPAVEGRGGPCPALPADGSDNGKREPPGPVNCNVVIRREAIKPYPRTCARCGLGPCPFYNKDRTVKP